MIFHEFSPFWPFSHARFGHPSVLRFADKLLNNSKREVCAMQQGCEVVRDVLISRLQEYPDTKTESVCASLGLDPDSWRGEVLGAKPTVKDKDTADHAGRIKFFAKYLHRCDSAAITIDGGGDGGSPRIIDGRHRYLAAVLNGDEVIRADIANICGNDPAQLDESVICYLIGSCGNKP